METHIGVSTCFTRSYGPLSGCYDTIEMFIRNKHPIDSSLKDPFKSSLSVKQIKRPPEIQPTQLKPIVHEKVPLPTNIRIDAILWGTNPVVIVKKDNETAFLKKGQTAWGITVTEIFKAFTTVTYQGNEFELRP